MNLRSSLRGCLLGTAVGDAIGLPREGLTRRRAKKRFGTAPLEHTLLFGRGMCSDDTEHCCLTAQALIASHGQPLRFATSLAWRLRFWLLGAPAGVGLATLRAIVKLWFGFNPASSGVRSAGNGPAMRAAPLGLYASHDIGLLRQLVRASTCLTHVDPRAEEGAFAVALAAREGLLRGSDNLSAHHFLATIKQHLVGGELLHHLQVAEELLAEEAPLEEFAERLGLSSGVTGYINHTVPIAIFAWLRYPHDFRQAVEECVCLGGDTDTTGAIVGALAGATLGPDAIPSSWRAGIFEWPRSCDWIEALADRLAATFEGGATIPCPLFWPALLPRNAFFASVVLTHGFSRLLPPY